MGAADHDRRIAAMFDRISPRYDRLNRVLSFGTDLRWRRRAVAAARLNDGDLAIDVGAGTGDLAFALLAAAPSRARVIGADISPGMLAISRQRAAELGLGSRYVPLLASAEAIPLPDGSAQRIVSGFTMRNVGDLAAALREFHRVLRVDGRLVVLELSHPPSPLFAALYRTYFERIAPGVARLFGGDREAYRYLPRSLRPFPGAEAFAMMLRDAGFRRVRFERLTFGIAALHVAEP